MWVYVIWAAILLIIILMLVRMRSMFSIYICPKCQHEYTLSPVKEFLFPQVLYRKISRCPRCRRLVAAGIIRNEESIATIEEFKKKDKKRVKSKT